jgi:divalent metal cation (Fe/Co/Zn/Cd) transporter
MHASIKRSNAGLRAVSLSLIVRMITALAQVAMFVATSSVALLADLVHNFGDALTAVPLGAAFLLRSFKAEKRAGYVVVSTIFISACVAAAEAVNRLINPHHIDPPPRAHGRRRDRLRRQRDRSPDPLARRPQPRPPALIADGNHARTDGIVSVAVVASAIVVALGLDVGDPIIGLTIAIVILPITWQSFRTVRGDPGEPADHEHPEPAHPHTAAAGRAEHLSSFARRDA